MHYSLIDVVTDIVQNGAESGADLVELCVNEVSSDKGEFSFTVKDNGKGMKEDELKIARDPFVCDGIKQSLLKHPERKVGLGLPFMIQTAESTGGGWKIESSGAASGTTVSAWFDLGNVDTPPIGDIPGMFRTALLFNGLKEVMIHRTVGGRSYQVRKTELVDALGDLEDSKSLLLLDKYLRSLEQC